MRIDQARDVAHSFDVSDSAIVAQVLQEFSAVAQVQAGGFGNDVLALLTLKDQMLD